MRLCDELLQGAIDLHQHAAPSLFERVTDDIGLAAEARTPMPATWRRTSAARPGAGDGPLRRGCALARVTAVIVRIRTRRAATAAGRSGPQAMSAVTIGSRTAATIAGATCWPIRTP